MTGRRPIRDKRVLDYAGRARSPRRPRLATPAQFCIGFVSHIVLSGALVGLSYKLGGADVVVGSFMCGYVAVLLAVFIPGELLSLHYGWTGFIPGALTGVALTCLIAPAWVILLCGGIRL